MKDVTCGWTTATMCIQTAEAREILQPQVRSRLVAGVWVGRGLKARLARVHRGVGSGLLWAPIECE